MTPCRPEFIDLLDLHDWLTARGLTIISTRILGEFEGRLWVEAETTSVTATAGEVITDNHSEASSQPRQKRREDPA